MSDMSDLSREVFEKWYVDRWYEWRLKQGYDPVSKQEMLQNIILMRDGDKYEDGKDYLNHAWEGWQAAKQSMQGEAVGKISQVTVGMSLNGPIKSSQTYQAMEVYYPLPVDTKLFTYQPSATAKIAEQDAEIARLTKELEEARKDAVRYIRIRKIAAQHSGKLEKEFDHEIDASLNIKGGAE